MGLHYGPLVAFSGTVHDTDNGEDYTENGMNGLPPSVSIADTFKSPEYRILIVSNKFQTGFDEPMLHTMYVDKRLDGLQCVQALSRLNRVAEGKTDTLVLDFVNEPDAVQAAFQQYYQTTMLAEETDPNRLYDLQRGLEDFNLFDEHNIDRFCRVFYDPSEPDERLQGILDEVVQTWREREEDEREEFRSALQRYIRLYGYISQLITFTDAGLEKLYVFARSLNKKLPKREGTDVSDVLEAVDLDSFRVQQVHKDLQLKLESEDSEVPGIGSGTSVIVEPDADLLSNIIQALNDAHQTDFTDEDKVDIDTIRRKVNENEELRQVMEADNTERNRHRKFGEVLDTILLDFVNNKLELYNKLSRPEVKAYLLNHLYRAYRERPPSPHV